MDLCCHAGGFSIPAALAGARSVTAADLDEEPLGRAERAAAENAADVTFHHADAFDVLRATVDSKRRPGLLILDPHKLAKGKRDLEAAKVKYRDLNALGIAAAALVAWLRRRSAIRSESEGVRCLGCGHDLRGGSGDGELGRCSECGVEFRRVAAERMADSGAKGENDEP